MQLTTNLGFSFWNVDPVRNVCQQGPLDGADVAKPDKLRVYVHRPLTTFHININI